MSHRAFRYDVVKMSGPRKDHRGYLVADAILARTGIQEYTMADGKTRRELRPDDEVMHPDSLATLKGSVVVNNHPPMALDANNTKQFAVGFLKGDAKKGGKLGSFQTITDEMTIFDAKTIDDVMNKGKNQNSQGYFCDVDMSPGVHPIYGPYDAIQRNIKHNHSAIVDEGRAGPEVGIKMDSADGGVEFGMTYVIDADDPDDDGDEDGDEENEDDEEDIEIDDKPVQKKKLSAKEKTKLKLAAKKAKDAKKAKGDSPPAPPSEIPDEKKDGVQKKDYGKNQGTVISKNEGDTLMILFKLDGLEYQVDDKYDALFTKVVAKLKEVDTLKADNAQLAKNLDESKVEVEKLKVIVSDEKAMEAKVEERIQVKAVAKEMFPEETKIDSFSTIELQKKIVKKINPEMDVEKKDAAFIQGMALGVMASFKTDGTKKLEGAMGSLAKDGADAATPEFSMDKAQKSLNTFYHNAWKQPDPEKHDKGFGKTAAA